MENNLPQNSVRKNDLLPTLGSHLSSRRRCVRLSGNRLCLWNEGAASRRGNSEALRNRKKVEGFTESSAYRMRKFIREVTPEFRSFVTLTYPVEFEVTCAESKRHLKLFTQRLDRLFSDQANFAWFWFLEFQGNGQIHYHLLLTHYIHKKLLSQYWYDICQTGNPKHLKSGTSIESVRSGRAGIARYCSKYAQKTQSKQITGLRPYQGTPGRFWGSKRGIPATALTVKIGKTDMKQRKTIDNAENSAEFINKAIEKGYIEAYEPHIDGMNDTVKVFEVKEGAFVREFQKWFIKTYDANVDVQMGWGSSRSWKKRKK